MNHMGYGTKENNWLKANKKKLPSLKNSRRLRYVGAARDLAAIVENPRQGSDVYIGGEFEIHTVQTKISPICGSPRMPVKQWLHHGGTAHVL
jgi:hypothetical protein